MVVLKYLPINFLNYFFFLTPLNGFLSAFWSMKRPVSFFLLVQRLFLGFQTWSRFLTEPVRVMFLAINLRLFF